MMAHSRDMVAAVVILCSASNAGASALRASPILVDAGERLNMTLTLHNQEARPINAQVRVFRWTQNEGSDDLTPTDDVIASPPIASIGPNADFVVRLQRTTGTEPINEEAYRIVVDELPNPNRQHNGTVAVVLRYIIPAFFFSSDATQARLKWSLRHRNGHPIVTAENLGDKRIQIMDLGVKSGGRTMSIEKGLAGYVLGHSVKEWPLSAKLSNLRLESVAATSDHGAINASLAP